MVGVGAVRLLLRGWHRVQGETRALRGPRCVMCRCDARWGAGRVRQRRGGVRPGCVRRGSGWQRSATQPGYVAARGSTGRAQRPDPAPRSGGEVADVGVDKRFGVAEAVLGPRPERLVIPAMTSGSWAVMSVTFRISVRVSLSLPSMARSCARPACSPSVAGETRPAARFTASSDRPSTTMGLWLRS